MGPLTATAMVASVGSASDFKNGRQLAAWLGLVPRQHSSGDKRRLMGISKRGNRYLRNLMIHGARAVVRYCAGKEDPASRWLNALRRFYFPGLLWGSIDGKTGRTGVFRTWQTQWP